jgi:hypothetical protein
VFLAGFLQKERNWGFLWGFKEKTPHKSEGL